MAKFETDVSGAMLLPSLIQVTESISGSVVPLAMFSLPPKKAAEREIPSATKAQANSDERFECFITRK